MFIFNMIKVTVMRSVYKMFIGKSGGVRPPGRRSRTWTIDNVRMNLREIGWEGVDWINVARDRDQWRAVVNTVMNFRVP
jgi:hypothetical protein